jgi:hypothetical protein
MAGLVVPAIHVSLPANVRKTWMPGTSPGKTNFTTARLQCESPVCYTAG